MVTFAMLTDDKLRVRGPKQGQWTRADWETLPHGDGNRYEIIEGYLYVSTSPSLFHNWVINSLAMLVGIPALKRGLGYYGTIEVGVFMPGTQPVQPDFFFVRAERAAIMHDRHVNGVPDLIVEVVSPGNRAHDLETKFLAYEQAGVPEYGIADALLRQLKVYRLREDGRYGEAQTLGRDDSFAFACLPDIVFRVGDIFDGAPDTTL